MRMLSHTQLVMLSSLCSASILMGCLFNVNFDLPARASGSDAWMTWQFSGDNKPLELARANVTREVARSSDPTIIAEHYKSLAEGDPNNTIAVYSWAASVNASEANLKIPAKEVGVLEAGVKEALSRIDSRTYEFIRMRFFFELSDNQLDPNLRSLSDRLLSINNADPDVLRASACIWGSEPNKAIRLAREAIAAAPNDPRGYRTLGFVYVGVYVGSEKPNDGRSAIQAYQKFVDLAPRASDSRAEAEGWIVATEKILSRQAASSKK